jgi:hypothetical protein
MMELEMECSNHAGAHHDHRVPLDDARPFRDCARWRWPLECGMLAWFEAHEALLGWMTGASAAMFVASLVMVPWLVARIPADYFTSARRHGRLPSHHGLAVRLALRVGRNLLGYVVLAAGVAMLVLPGQGLLTMLIGIMLVDFPGKYRLERWIIAHGPVLRSINWLRRRAGREPLIVDG